MNAGKIIAHLREEKGWSQTNLANNSSVSRVMIGKYERGEAVPSIEAAKKIADAFNVSIDYLVGKTSIELSEDMLKRFQEVSSLPENAKKQIYMVMDALIRDFKTGQAYIAK